ncbi:MAG TPA: hypothetical protein VK997_09745, partial [Deferrisomatales bacterium]|nr:hypothetical protein [Deferrisomatales bacterium]
LNPYQSALRWVLQQSGVATTIPSMATFEQVREDAAVMGQAFTWHDAAALRLYGLAVNSRYCRACGSCSGMCPSGTDLPAALRGVMYAEGYGEEAMGRRAVAGAGVACGDCRGCSVICRFGVDLPRQLSAAWDLAHGPSA